MPSYTRTLLVCTAALLFFAGGCTSLDRHVFHSTELQPASVSVTDVASGEVLWSMDVPENQSLVLNFDGPGVPFAGVTGVPAESMKWKLCPLGEADSWGAVCSVEEQIDLSGEPIMMIVTYRDAEEAQEPQAAPRMEAAPVQEPAPEAEAAPAEEAAPMDEQEAGPAEEADAVEEDMVK